MKSRSLVLAFLLASTAFSHAADAVIYEAAPMEIAPIAIWTGGYVGLHAGYAWGRQNDNQSENFPNGDVLADRFDVDGFIGGAHAGYNWQHGQFVFGVEGDIDYADISGGSDFSYWDERVTGHLGFKSDWQGSLRLRAGYAMDTWLLYATGGVAFGHGKLSASTDFASASDENTHVGWTVGAGLEKMFTPNWIGRLEARYTDFGKKTYDLGPDLGDDVDSDWNQTTVSVGVSYKF